MSKPIRNTMDWCIVTIVLAAHYGQIYFSPFYAELACWYIKGHFPCGWEGIYPKGRLIVY